MNRPVGVCITQNSRNPTISSAYKWYAFYYFYIVVLSVSVCQKKKKKNSPNNKKEIYNDKYRHTRDRLFGLCWYTTGVKSAPLEVLYVPVQNLFNRCVPHDSY